MLPLSPQDARLLPRANRCVSHSYWQTPSPIAIESCSKLETCGGLGDMKVVAICGSGSFLFRRQFPDFEFGLRVPEKLRFCRIIASADCLRHSSRSLSLSIFILSTCCEIHSSLGLPLVYITRGTHGGLQTRWNPAGPLAAPPEARLCTI